MRRAISLVLPLALVAACQIVGRLQSRVVDPIVQGCALPTNGDAQLRLANFLPRAGSIDFCVKSSGAADYDQPILRGAGLSCGGLGFKDVTVLFAARSGPFDAKAIASDAHVCSAPAVAEAKGLPLPTGEGTTLFLAGGNGVAPAIFAAGEGTAGATSGTKFRPLNAIGGTTLVFGLMQDSRLPTVLSQPLTGPVPFGHVAPAATTPLGAIDAFGYLNTAVINTYSFGAAPLGSTAGDIDIILPSNAGKYSLYALGDPTQSLAPVRALLCDEAVTGEDAGAGAVRIACKESDPSSITVDVFSTGIIGAFGAFDQLRADAVVQAIAGRTSDVMCIPELARNDKRKAAIAAAAQSSQFPYVAAVDTDETTPATDPTDQDGGTPPQPTTPPCGDPSIMALAEKTYQCLISRCASPAGDPNGILPNDNFDCASNLCSGPIAPLFVGTLAQKRCFGCILTGMVSYTPFSAAKTACETDVQAGYAFGGDSPTFILSKHPLTNVEAFVLPSTGFRRSVVRAELQLDQGASIDLYCAKLSPDLSGSAPYFGPYGAAWSDENTLRARKLVAWVKQKTAPGQPAIVMGEFDSSLAYTQDDGGLLVASSLPATMATLTAAFPDDAVTPGYVPTCTFCPPPANPYNGNAPTGGLWSTKAFLYNFSAGAMLSAGTTMKEPVVPLGGDAGLGPLSTHWAYSFKVQRK